MGIRTWNFCQFFNLYLLVKSGHVIKKSPWNVFPVELGLSLCVTWPIVPDIQMWQSENFTNHKLHSFYLKIRMHWFLSSAASFVQCYCEHYNAAVDAEWHSDKTSRQELELTITTTTDTCASQVTNTWHLCTDIDIGNKVGMYRISGSGSGWPDIRPFFLIRFRLRFRPKWNQVPDISAG